MLSSTIVAGPRARAGDLPDHVDVLGQFHGESPTKWHFSCVAPPARGQEPHAHPTWTMRPAFGVSESGVILMGIALALIEIPGARDVGRAIAQRAQLRPDVDILAAPALIEACRPLGNLPLAVVITAAAAHRVAPMQEAGRALSVTTGWPVTVIGVEI